MLYVWKAHNVASIYNTDKEERAQEDKAINELSSATSASSLVQKPELGSE